MSFSPNDNPVQNDSSAIKNNNFGGNRTVTTGDQRKSQDYTSPTGGAINIKKNPTDVIMDIDDMSDSKSRKREFSRRAETQDHSDHNKGRFSESSSGNRPLEDTDVTTIPDDKHIRSKLKNQFGEGPYNIVSDEAPTYWEAEMAGYWNTEMIDLWNTNMNEEV